jgi:hypothetical protein
MDTYTATEVVMEMIDASKETIHQVDEDIKITETTMFQTIMKLSHTKSDKLDFAIDMLSDLLKTTKMEKMLCVAITKQNWELLNPMRNKYRQLADALMENMEKGVENDLLSEETYINNANHLKNTMNWVDDALSVLRKIGLVM